MFFFFRAHDVQSYALNSVRNARWENTQAPPPQQLVIPWRRGTRTWVTREWMRRAAWGTGLEKDEPQAGRWGLWLSALGHHPEISELRTGLSVSLCWLHLHVALLMLLFHLLVFPIKGKESKQHEGTNVPSAVAAQQLNWVALEGKVSRLRDAVCLLHSRLPDTSGFQEAW